MSPRRGYCEIGKRVHNSTFKAMAASTYVQVDDTGARHQGHNGFCTHIGNALFAYFVRWTP